MKYCYIIPFIFKTLGSEISPEAEPIISFSFNIFILSLIALICFINIIGYFISIYLLEKYKVEEKFPKYYKLMMYYKKRNIFFVIIEIIICFLSLITLIIINLGVLGLFVIF